MPEDNQDWLILGRVSGVFGVKGWVKVFSETAPRKNILRYPEWFLRRNGEWQPYRVIEGQEHGKGIIARLEGIGDRELAATLARSDIAIRREDLPEADEDEYYWADLEGLTVVTLDGVELGRIKQLFETGANDVMVVKGDRERLLPFIADVVRDVDLEQGLVRVDWDPEF